MCPMSLTAVGVDFVVIFPNIGGFTESSSALGRDTGVLGNGQNFEELERKGQNDRRYITVMRMDFLI